MDALATLLTPPEVCSAKLSLTFKDKRRGGLWFCDHAKKVIGKGRSCPPCLCAEALSKARASRLQSEGRDG